MAVNIIGAIVLLLVIFGVIVSAIGFVSFTNAFKKEYDVSTYHMADTATTPFRSAEFAEEGRAVKVSYLAGEDFRQVTETLPLPEA